MKTRRGLPLLPHIFISAILISPSLFGAEPEPVPNATSAPPANMIERARWARETKDLALRITRLEELLKLRIPLEEGAKVDTEYEDGSAALAVTGSAWVLARAYVEAGEKEKALRVIDWLQENDSKSDLSPKKPEGE